MATAASCSVRNFRGNQGTLTPRRLTNFSVVGYVLFMLPANIFLRWIRPYLLVGGAIVCFGTLLCGMSAAQTYGAVLATRILIGAAQAFVQGIGMYSSLWYTRRELAIRGCTLACVSH